MRQPVRLRPVAEQDLPLLEQFALDREARGTHQWFGRRPVARLRQDFAEHGFLTEDGGRLIVEVDGTAVGDVSWIPVDNGPGTVSRCWNIGITLLPQWRGRGIGSVAQRLLAEELFATTLVARVEAATDVDNVAERRALEKAGFVYEGTLRRLQFRDGAWRDVALYSLLRGE